MHQPYEKGVCRTESGTPHGPDEASVSTSHSSTVNSKPKNFSRFKDQGLLRLPAALLFSVAPEPEPWGSGLRATNGISQPLNPKHVQTQERNSNPLRPYHTLEPNAAYNPYTALNPKP